jgi:hypothetical protein
MIDALVVTALSEAEVGSVSGGSGVSGWGDGMVDIKKEEMVVVDGRRCEKGVEDIVLSGPGGSG